MCLGYSRGQCVDSCHPHDKPTQGDAVAVNTARPWAVEGVLASEVVLSPATPPLQAVSLGNGGTKRPQHERMEFLVAVRCWSCCVLVKTFIHELDKRWKAVGRIFGRHQVERGTGNSPDERRWVPKAWKDEWLQMPRVRGHACWPPSSCLGMGRRVRPVRPL